MKGNPFHEGVDGVLLGFSFLLFHVNMEHLVGPARINGVVKIERHSFLER